jgi:uncharacterized protein YecT (DUF1311 family)
MTQRLHLTVIGFMACGAVWATCPARAADSDYAGMLLQNQSLLTDPPKTCGDKNASLNTFEMQQCSAVAFKAADAAMNKAYQAAIEGGSPSQNGKLKQAQRLWLSLRNVECDWESLKYEGGTLAPVVMGNCLVDITKARTATLKNALEP